MLCLRAPSDRKAIEDENPSRSTSSRVRVIAPAGASKADNGALEVVQEGVDPIP